MKGLIILLQGSNFDIPPPKQKAFKIQYAFFFLNNSVVTMGEGDLNLGCLGTPRGANRLSSLAKLNLQIAHYHIIPKSLAFHSHSSYYINIPS